MLTGSMPPSTGPSRAARFSGDMAPSAAKEGLMDAQSRSRRLRVSGIAAHVRAGAAAFPCHLEELSPEGAFLLTDHPVEAGTALEVDLVKPGGRQPLHLRAVVLRAVPGRAGQQPGLDVEFRLVPSDNFQRLVGWMDELKARTSKVPATGRAAIAHLPPEVDAGSKRNRLRLQIRGLLPEMDDLRDRLRLRDAEVDDLRRQLATAEQLLGRRVSVPPR